VTLRKLFVSYARENKRDVDQLVEHLGTMGYETWVDAALRGGQDWWDEILARIADSDVVIAIYSSAALNSTACGREFEWAVALGKPVVPVAVEPPPSALPTRFARRQIIDYSQPLERPLAALKLQGALATLPPAPPLPDPLPDPPTAPLSYLTDLIDLISQASAVDHDQQHQILRQLEPALTSLDPLERRGGSDILERFSRRPDLYADVDRAITRLRQLADPPVPVGGQAERSDIHVDEHPARLVDRNLDIGAQEATKQASSSTPNADDQATPTQAGGAGRNPLGVPALLVMAFATLGLLSFVIEKATTWPYDPVGFGSMYWSYGALLTEVRYVVLAVAYWRLYKRFPAGQRMSNPAITSLVASILVAVVVLVDVVMRFIGGATSRGYLQHGYQFLSAAFFAAMIAVALSTPKPRQNWSWLIAIGGGIGLVRAMLPHTQLSWLNSTYVIYLVVVLAGGILMYRQHPVTT
jgi:TIR domain